jgi:hypothetical protein
MTHPRATLVLLAIQDDRLKVLVQNTSEGTVRLPSGPGDPELDSDLAFTCRRLSRDLIGDLDYQMIPINTFSKAARSGGFDVHQVWAGLARPDEAPTELPEGSLFVDLEPLLSKYAMDGSELERPFELETDQLHALSLTSGHLKELSGRSKYPAFLVPKEFTMTELIRAYELLAGQPIDQASFRRKVESVNFLQEAGERRVASRRPAKTYQMIGFELTLRKFLTMQD